MNNKFKILFPFVGTLQEARKKTTRAQFTSDLETSEEPNGSQKKWKIMKPARYESEESEIEEEQLPTLRINERR
jgi:hypothetical protein